MSERSLSIRLYLLGHALFGRRSRKLHPNHTRPNGRVIWVQCRGPMDIAGVTSVIGQMLDQHEPANFVLTGTGQEPGIAADGLVLLETAPRTAAETRRFIRFWKPSALVWLGGELSAPVLATADALGVPRVWADASNVDIRPPHERWLAGMRRALLRRFETVLTIDSAAIRSLTRLGAPVSATLATGLIEAEPPLLPCNESERLDMATVLGSRPVWLAVNCCPAEISFIAQAHKQASRRSHRLLLIVVPNVVSHGPAFKKMLTDAGMETALRSEDELTDTTRAYVADLEGELGLWYRLSPITWMGGTIEGTPLNPLEPAALGSVVIRGPKTAPYASAFLKLSRGEASISITHTSELATTVEALLAPDKVAVLANNAWMVTTEGADAINRLSDVLGNILESEAA